MNEDTTFQTFRDAFTKAGIQSIIDAGEAPTWDKAQKIVDEYRIVYVRDNKAGYLGSSTEIPTISVEGKTLKQCSEFTRQALIFAVVGMLESGQTPPSPQCVITIKSP